MDISAALRRTMLATAVGLTLGVFGPVEALPAETFVAPELDTDYEPVRAAFAAAIGRGRPMENGCTQVPASPEIDALLEPYRSRQASIPNGAERFPIRYCRYVDHGVSARVLTMNPDAEQIARWVVGVCRASSRIGPTLSRDQCVVAAARMIWLQANAQFPISGMVVEPASLCNATWTGQARFGFRHGVTVALAGVPPTPGDPIEDPCGAGATAAPSCTTAAMADDVLEAVLTAPVVKTAPSAYARLSNLSRQAYSNPPPGRCPTVSGGQPPWLDVSRDGYLSALGSDRYPMLATWIARTELSVLTSGRFACRPIGPTLLADCP